MTTIVIALLTGSFGAAFVSAAASLLTWYLNRKSAKADRTDNLAAGLRWILYYHIKHECEEAIAQGWISADRLEDLIAMHAVYHDDLGGNGFLDNLMAAVKRLPIK